MEDGRQRVSFAQQRLLVRQLLVDHADVYQKGLQEASVDATQEYRSGPGHNPLNAAYVKRYMGKDDNSLRAVEAKSHRYLEKEMDELRKTHPDQAGAIDSVHFRSTAGHRDIDFLREKAKTNSQIQTLVMLYDWGIDLLTLRLWAGERYKELYAVFGRKMSRSETDAMETQNRRVLLDYDEAQTRHKTKQDAKVEVCYRHGISERTLERIVEARRLERGEPKRGKGRPRKEES